MPTLRLWPLPAALCLQEFVNRQELKTAEDAESTVQAHKVLLCVLCVLCALCGFNVVLFDSAIRVGTAHHK